MEPVTTDDAFLNFTFANVTKGLQIPSKQQLEVYKKFVNNRRVDEPAASLLILAYSILITIGACGNILAIAAVARKPKMFNVRNIFIVNLASSDLLLCLVTMPLTLVETLSLHWPFGDTAFFCRLTGTLQAISVFVSTFSIAAIALDRCRVIVYPTEKCLQKRGAFVVLVAIWSFSFLLALPNFIWRALDTHEINLPELQDVHFCIENWPTPFWRVNYCVFVIFIQYFLPILTVGIAHCKICNKLRTRMSAACKTATDTKRYHEEIKMRKTSTLLSGITLIFCLSWLPLNLYNLLLDIRNMFGVDQEFLPVTYALCHMAGMSSACSNPLLYGWLNENFRKEFLEIFLIICPFASRRCVPCRVSRDGDMQSSERATLSLKTKSPTYGKPSEYPEDFSCNGLIQEYETTQTSQILTTNL